MFKKPPTRRTWTEKHIYIRLELQLILIMSFLLYYSYISLTAMMDEKPGNLFFPTFVYKKGYHWEHSINTPVYLFAYYFDSLVWFSLFGYLTSSSTTRLYIADGPQVRASDNFYVLPHMRQSWETMTSVSAGHIILTPTQSVGSGRPQRESNP